MAEASECRPRRGAAAAGLHGRGRGREGGWGVRRGSASAWRGRGAGLKSEHQHVVHYGMSEDRRFFKKQTRVTIERNSVICRSPTPLKD